jgi:hypothetical protein
MPTQRRLSSFGRIKVPAFAWCRFAPHTNQNPRPVSPKKRRDKDGAPISLRVSWAALHSTHPARYNRGLMAGWPTGLRLSREALLNSARTAVAALASLLLARTLLKLPEFYWAPISTIVILLSRINPTTLACSRLQGQRWELRWAR